MDFAWRPPTADVVLAAGLVFAFSEPGFDPYHHASGTLWAAAGALAAAALAWRRGYPLAVWLVCPPRRPYWCWSPGIALECGLLTHNSRLETVGTTAALVVAAWATGESTRARNGALEADRAARGARAAADERARIARELHDIVAHHVSVISLQAGTARLLAESGAPPEAGLLAGIETASRQAMTELRHALGVIKHTPGGAAPQPGLARLDELTADCGVMVTVDGAAGTLPASADLTAYRVIQEGLTNVLRHSAATGARVTLRRYPDSLHVTVADDGPARATHKDARPEDLIDGVRVVAAGDALLAPSVTRRLIRLFTEGAERPRDHRLDMLTARELDVLVLVARGMSNAEIGAELRVSGNTVKTHVAHLLTKLGLRDRVHAVIFAYESGLPRD